MRAKQGPPIGGSFAAAAAADFSDSKGGGTGTARHLFASGAADARTYPGCRSIRLFLPHLFDVRRFRLTAKCSRVETQLIHHVMIAAMKIAAAKFVASLSYRVA
ncbi:hypothetical protein, partial [Aquamicrobium defluvii]